MDMPTSSPTLEMIARTIDEFSFIFTGFPPRLPLSVKQQHYRATSDNHRLSTDLSNVYPSPSPQRGYFSERKDKLPPQHRHLREDRSEGTELATPLHIHYDSNHSVISAKSCSSTESTTLPSTESESKGYPLPPHTDIPTTAKLEMPNCHCHVHPPTTEKRYQLPKDYTKLPHFHPPRFSRRLRDLIAERRRPMGLHLVPVLRIPVQNEEKSHVAESYWVITSPDAEAARVKPRRSWKTMDRRILLLITFVTLFGVIMLVFAMALGWVR